MTFSWEYVMTEKKLLNAFRIAEDRNPFFLGGKYKMRGIIIPTTDALL